MCAPPLDPRDKTMPQRLGHFGFRTARTLGFASPCPKCARPVHERNNVPVRRQHTFEPQSCRATCQFASSIKNVPEDGLRSAKVTTVGRRIRIVPHDVRAENGLDCRPIPPGSRLIQHLYEAHVGMLALPFCTAHFSNLSNARHRAASELWRKAT
jgi:hypothetical protein